MELGVIGLGRRGGNMAERLLAGGHRIVTYDPRREAIEETDCTVSDIFPVCHYLVSPGGTSESVFVYCGRVSAPKGGGR